MEFIVENFEEKIVICCLLSIVQLIVVDLVKCEDRSMQLYYNFYKFIGLIIYYFNLFIFLKNFLIYMIVYFFFQ